MPEADDLVHSAVLFVDGLDARELQRRLEPLLPPEVAVTPSGLPGSVELTAPGVHKGSGLAWLCGRIGVDAAAVVAFGDGLNDHEMLAWSGWGVAMGNAEPVTQELADEVTASNDEDGVALVLERLLADDHATARAARRSTGEQGGRDMTAPSGRIDAYLVCGGAWHDFDFARLELLKLLAEDERVRVKVAEHYEDLDAITAADFLVTYTCDVRPSEAAQQALRGVGRGRWPMVRAPRDEHRHRPAGGQGRGPVHDAAGLPGLRRHPRQPVPLPPDDRALPRDDHARGRGGPARRGHRGLRRQRRAVPVRVPRRARAAPADPLDGRRTASFERLLVAGRRPSAGHVPPAPRPWLRALPDPGALPGPLRHGRHRPHDGSYWPKVERGSWEVAEFYELLRRGLSWAAAPARAAVPPGRPGGAPV